MTLRYDAEKASTAVLIQGCVAAERDELYKWLHTMQRFAGHPLLAIALFFEMYSRDLRETYDNLHTKYLEHFLETFSTDIDRLNKYRPHLKHATDMYDDQMTAQAEISAIQGRLARLIASIEYVTDKSPPGPRGDYMQEYGGKIKDRLLAMSDDLDYLHTKCANTKEGLQLLISAVGSMSALAESEISQQLAMTGHQVSIASKRDSTIMKAIAVGTLTFLPATAIASIFAMPVLDWDHPPGQGVAGRQFGIYLAVSIPMTLVTLMFLFAWMNMVDFEAETAKTSIRPSIRLRLGRLTAGLLLAQKPAINNVSKP
ncbi:uncharacterized protein HMPREF1541_01892 [Cyphellophora europaea CBS 101466]|uniref:Ankyrin repeat protein n=1 Tax=Cyphellophora europaea (strain CBS 101466) TaxID=1220924 RepID=W2S443_CYPE1|nr:uncharacterized protein HMPREF1541_01892 [Cyphellophora europaea CBS 101466]ETN42734.1 hypothetical protein HMPREF1541_01892 [Cyphellophora europaea CBS 101466]